MDDAYPVGSFGMFRTRDVMNKKLAAAESDPGSFLAAFGPPMKKVKRLAL
jgi:hypothetical protein